MVWFARIALAILLIFELLNFAGILNFTLDFSWIGLVITLVVVWGAVELGSYFLKKKGCPALAGSAYLALTIGLYIDALGDILRLYGRFGWYDDVAHIIGGLTAFVVVTTVLMTLKECGKISMHPILVLALSISIVMALGTLYEIEEYLEDIFWHGRAVRLGDGPDTARDLLFNAIGATLGVVTAIWLQKSEARNSKS